MSLYKDALKLREYLTQQDLDQMANTVDKLLQRVKDSDRGTELDTILSTLERRKRCLLQVPNVEDSVRNSALAENEYACEVVKSYLLKEDAKEQKVCYNKACRHFVEIVNKGKVCAECNLKMDMTFCGTNCSCADTGKK